ncbi:helix-turn-helix domain-containing protein [Rhizobium mongolense]
MTGNDILSEFVSREDLATLLKISPRTIARYSTLPNGLPSLMIGGRAMYRLSSVQKWLESREKQPNPIGSRRRRSA